MTADKQSIGPYKLIAAIGAGGMGEVFRARDTRLNRDVAVKVLPKDFSGDADRLRRFEQEAKTLAALNHPNVLTIFDTGVLEGAPYLVSELLEGKTMREEMNGAALPVRKATDYGLQIAQGLAAAHGAGIVHRDLKPENVFITKDGRVKILDFGLAKLQSDLKSEISDSKSPADPDAPTLAASTQPGAVLGTPAYMSPEQVRGELADHRSDIFAFGCVLYEMLSGTRAFRRDTPVASMNAVLSQEPPDLSAANANVPAALERIVLRCLEKLPGRRFQTANDLAFAIENAGASTTHIAGPGRRREAMGSLRSPLVPWTAAGLCLVGLLWVLLRTHTPALPHPQSRPVRKLELTLATPGTVPPPTARVWPVISPDGRKIAYGTSDGLWLSWLDQLAPPVALAKGEDLLAPFWSPQSTDVAYFDGKTLVRVSISEKRPITIATLPESVDRERAGGAWLTGERIIFTTGEPALYEVPAQGGNVVRALAGDKGETSFASATALPDGRGLLFLLRRSGEHTKAIVAWTPSGQRRVALEVGGMSVQGLACSPTGQVLFDRWDATRGIWAFPFSLQNFRATGELRRISDRGYLPSVAHDGTLVCGIGGEQDSACALRRLAWVDHSGKVRAATARPLPCLAGVRLSPDGQRAVAMAGESIDSLDIWLFDLASGQVDRLTQTPVQEALPGWWDQGRTIVFSRWPTNGPTQMVSKPAQAIGHEEILAPDFFAWTAFSASKLLLGKAHGHGEWGYLSLSGGSQAFVPLPQQLQRIGQPEFSPDGRLLAYRAPEFGPGEVYVVDFPDFTHLRQISRGGGFDPQWHPGSTELFFLSDDGRALMSARQKTGSPDFEAPTKVFDLPPSIDPGRPGWPPFYSVSPDGDRFLMLQNSEDLSPGVQAAKANAMLIENWSGSP